MKPGVPTRVNGTGLSWPKRVPPGASFKETLRNEGCVSGEFLLESGKMHVVWSLDGTVLSECPFDRNGLRHGLELSRHGNGLVEWQVRWVHGFMHGSANQFDEKGHVLCRSPFRHGSGIDVWVQSNEVVEFRELIENKRQGVERWGHPMLPYEEAYYHRGQKVGIHRRWNATVLEEGYPKFFVDDAEVSKETYRHVRAKRMELPAYRIAEDSRVRRLPATFRDIWLQKEIRAALVKRPGPYDTIGCGAHVQGIRDIP